MTKNMFEDLHRPRSSLLATAGIDWMWKSSKPAHRSTSFMGWGVCFPTQSPVERTYSKYGCCLLRSQNILCPPAFLFEKFSGQVSKTSPPGCQSAHRVFSYAILALPRDPEQVLLHSVMEITKEIQILDKYLTKDPLCTYPLWTNCIFCMNISVTWFFFQ